MASARFKGGLMATIGYLLSPLSFWNDVFINFPIAFAFGTVVGLASREFFLPGVVAGYWLSNIAGLVLLHLGAAQAVSGKEEKYTNGRLAKDLALSVGYTIIIIALIYFGIVSFPEF